MAPTPCNVTGDAQHCKIRLLLALFGATANSQRVLQGIQDFSNGTGALDNRMVQAKGETLGAYSARPIVPGVPNLGAVGCVTLYRARQC